MRLFTSILGVALPFGAVIYGQSGADILGGNAGWAGAGLLGLVLAWLLLKHLPDRDKQNAEKDKQITDLITRNDERQDAMRKEHVETISTLATTFKAEQAAERQLHKEQLTAEREACERHFATLADSTQGNFKNLSESMQASFKAVGDLFQSRTERDLDWKDRLERQAHEKKSEGGK
jgi:hypothetical protein